MMASSSLLPTTSGLAMPPIASATTSTATSTSESPLVAPLISFASPYSADWSVSLIILLKRIISNTTLKISIEAEVLLARIADRLAHYLLAVLHYHGTAVESEWSQSHRFIYSQTTNTSSASSSSLVAAEHIATPSSSLAFRFPDRVGLTPSLVDHVYSAGRRALAQTQKSAADQPPNRPLITNPVFVDRWCTDFQKCLQIERQQSYTLEDKIVLGAYLECIMMELLELTGRRAQENKQSEIRGCDLFVGVEMDGISRMLRFLQIDWSIKEIASAGGDLTLVTPSLGLLSSKAFDDGFWSLLEYQWKNQLDEIAKTDSYTPCWFSSSSQLHSVARQFARGELRDSAVSLSLRQYQCRPYRYWGRQSRPWGLYDAFLNPDPITDGTSSAGRYSYVSFLLTDGVGEEWHFMIQSEWWSKSNAPSSVSGSGWGASRGFSGFSGFIGGFPGVDAAAATFEPPPNNDTTSPSDPSGTESHLIRGQLSIQPRVWSITFTCRDETTCELKDFEVKFGLGWEPYWPKNLTTQQIYQPHAAYPRYQSAEAHRLQQKILKDLHEFHRITQLENNTVSLLVDETLSRNASVQLWSPLIRSLSLLFYSLPCASSSFQSDDWSITRYCPPGVQLAWNGSEERLSGFTPKQLLALKGYLPRRYGEPEPPPIPVISPTFPDDPRLKFDPRGSFVRQKMLSRVETHFQSLLPNLLYITDYAKYGPQLFLANQPVSTRREFTSLMLDESMIAADMTPLPAVLLSIICDYHTFDLPYLDQEQMQKIQVPSSAPLTMVKVSDD